MSKQSFKVCFCFRRIFKLRRAEPPYDIRQAFQLYSENGTMSIDKLHRFLIEFQGEANATQEDAQAIFQSLKHLNIFQRKGLHFEGFLRYLFGDHNLPLPFHLGVHHDMKAPLAHYFIYTGHNSYLTGNQLSSDSSIEPIIKALRNGVRVIELDLWPNSNKDDINVCHGGTLTSPVKLINCLQAIKIHAFDSSEYPVILTFEDHLTPDLQAKVAKMVTETLGDTLFCPDLEFKELPSPESLKKKIMISTKPPKEYLEPEKKGGTDNVEDHQDEDVQNVVAEYRHLIAIHAVKLKGSIENWLRDDNKVKRLSLSEQELEAASATHGTHFVRFTQRNLLRVYPKGTRVDSSNYSPLVGWMHGAQMVAFNMQGYGKYLWRMQGMFRSNGGCGYVKKPDVLLNTDKFFDPTETLPIKRYLKVKVYMGEGWHSDFHHTHFDQFSPPDFYTRVRCIILD
ncbi:hypothetical protein LguiA_020858 [Lonicera macranthoides]